MNATTHTPSRAAWRQPMVWLMLALPFSVVLAGSATIVIAASAPLHTAPEAVRRVAQMQSTDLSADRAALAAGLAGTLTRREGRFSLAIPGARGTLLRVALVHPVDARRDRALSLREGEFIDHDAPGTFNLTVEDVAGRWRLVGRLESGADTATLAPRWTP